MSKIAVILRLVPKLQLCVGRSALLDDCGAELGIINVLPRKS